jgi:O-antigen/teichoic acid export membrane protein
VAELAAGAAGTSFLLASGVLHGGVAAFLWAHVLAAGVAVVVARRAALPFLPAGGAQRVRISALLRQAASFGATAAVQSLYTRLDVLLLGQMATTVALGLYNVAYKPTNLAVYFGATVAGTLFPLMVQAPGTEAPATFRRAMRGLGAAAPAMALAFSGLAGPLLRVLYGVEFAGATPILILLAWSAAANWLYAPLGVALQARGQERWWLASLAGGLALNAAANLWAIPRLGAFGAAAATLASEVALLGFGAVLVRRKLGILPSLRAVLVGLGATAAGGAVLWVLGAVGAVPATLAALIVYGGLLSLFRVVTAEDAVRVIGWVRQAAPGWSRG